MVFSELTTRVPGEPVDNLSTGVTLLKPGTRLKVRIVSFHQVTITCSHVSTEINPLASKYHPVVQIQRHDGSRINPADRPTRLAGYPFGLLIAFAGNLYSCKLVLPAFLKFFLRKWKFNLSEKGY